MKTLIYLSTKKTNSKQLAPVYCKIAHGSEKTEIALGVFVQKKDFDIKSGLVKKKCNMALSFNKRITQSHARIYDIITCLENQGIYQPNLVKEIFRNKKRFEIIDLNKELPSFIVWCNEYITKRYTEKYRSLRAYQHALGHLLKIESKLKQTITRIDKKLAKIIYECLENDGLLYYMTKIKYLSKQYHANFDEDNPIEKYRSIHKSKYFKGALTREELNKIICYKSSNSKTQMYIDLFLFQYYSAGSRVGDVLRMRWEDIQVDLLFRREEKTGKERKIPINKGMQKLLNKYKVNNLSAYVFDLNQPIQITSNQEWSLYKDRIIANINSALRTVRNTLKIKTPISTHTSRHTFATHTYEITKDIKLTSLMIGHSKLATTEMYLHREEELSLDLFKEVFGD